MTAFITAIQIILVMKLMSYLKSFAEKTKLICHKKKRPNSLTQILFPSVFSICICMVCIFSMTWAWFSEDVSCGTNIIRAAQYDIGVEVKNSDNGETMAPNANGEYELPSGTYSITLTAIGDASTGYCKIRISDGEEIYTEQINRSNSITFTIEIQDSSSAIETQDGSSTIEIQDNFRTLSFYPIWGISNKETIDIVNGTVYIVEPIEEETTTPEEDEEEESEDTDTEELDDDTQNDEEEENKSDEEEKQPQDNDEDSNPNPAEENPGLDNPPLDVEVPNTEPSEPPVKEPDDSPGSDNPPPDVEVPNAEPSEPSEPPAQEPEDSPATSDEVVE